MENNFLHINELDNTKLKYYSNKNKHTAKRLNLWINKRLQKYKNKTKN